MSKVKILGPSELECEGCPHRKRNSCHHPEFRDYNYKPFCIAEQDMKYPVFCPLVKKAQNTKRRDATRANP